MLLHLANKAVLSVSKFFKALKINRSFYTLVNSAGSHLSSDRAQIVSARKAQICNLLMDKQKV